MRAIASGNVSAISGNAGGQIPQAVAKAYQEFSAMVLYSSEDLPCSVVVINRWNSVVRLKATDEEVRPGVGGWAGLQV